MCHANTNQKNADIAILISDKAVLKARSAIEFKEETFHSDKMSVHPEDRTILNLVTWLKIYKVKITTFIILENTAN